MSKTKDHKRRRIMRACANATESEIEFVMASLRRPKYTTLREPEVGLVMLRGRIGGDGAPFNLGEATATRAAVQLDTGEMGFAHILGRSKDKALSAAIIDALGQRSEFSQKLRTKLVEPVEKRHARSKQQKLCESAATRVNFFTLARGEDQ